MSSILPAAPAPIHGRRDSDFEEKPSLPELEKRDHAPPSEEPYVPGVSKVEAFNKVLYQSGTSLFRETHDILTRRHHWEDPSVVVGCVNWLDDDRVRF
jgi:hypothetical protein